MPRFLSPAEIEVAIRNISFFALQDIGNENWLCVQERVVRLSQQLIPDAKKINEERVVKPLVRFDKLRVLAKELATARQWRIQMFWRPHIRAVYWKMTPEQRMQYEAVQSQHPERLYPFGNEDVEPQEYPTDDLAHEVFVYENAVLQLLSTALLYRSVYLEFKDENLDITQYVYNALTQLHILAEVRLIQHDFEIDHYGTVYSGVKRMCLKFMMDNGMLCLSMLRNMLEHAHLLHTQAFALLVESNRIPRVLCLILHFRPWHRYTCRADEVYNGQGWITVPRNFHKTLSTAEINAWVALTHCLSKPNLCSKFHMTPELCDHLGLIKTKITVYKRCKIESLRLLKRFLDNAKIEETNFTPSTRLQIVEALTIDHFEAQPDPAVDLPQVQHVPQNKCALVQEEPNNERTQVQQVLQYDHTQVQQDSPSHRREVQPDSQYDHAHVHMDPQNDLPQVQRNSQIDFPEVQQDPQRYSRQIQHDPQNEIEKVLKHLQNVFRQVEHDPQNQRVQEQPDPENDLAQVWQDLMYDRAQVHRHNQNYPTQVHQDPQFDHAIVHKDPQNDRVQVLREIQNYRVQVQQQPENDLENVHDDSFAPQPKRMRVSYLMSKELHKNRSLLEMENI